MISIKSNTVNTFKHIHEVIFLIEKSHHLWTPDELIESISNAWGEDVLFGACSGKTFPKEYALDFLLSRQKVFLNEEGRVALHPSMSICNGHEEFSK